MYRPSITRPRATSSKVSLSAERPRRSVPHCVQAGTVGVLEVVQRGQVIVCAAARVTQKSVATTPAHFQVRAGRTGRIDRIDRKAGRREGSEDGSVAGA